ncbi:MAG: TIGR02679 domain-containing protein, partial [Defluviitaleaceae bacterium]|nr:TIGR02679 domain-containing protein [Defluviitaleaceae bacterium]
MNGADNDINRCVSYFKDNKEFGRLISNLHDLFVRHERCFGAVRLPEPSREEEKAISVFFKRDYYNQQLIRIGLADFERQLQKIYGDAITLEKFLEAYYEKQIIKKE